MKSLRVSLLVAGCLGLGVATGYVAGQARSSVVQAQLEHQARQLAVLSEAVLSLRSEVGRVKVITVPAPAAAAGVLPPADVPAAAPAPAPGSPAEQADEGNEEQTVRAEELVDSALTAAVWTEQDAAELRSLAGSLSLAARSGLHERLAANLNAGKLRYEGLEPPF